MTEYIMDYPGVYGIIYLYKIIEKKIYLVCEGNVRDIVDFLKHDPSEKICIVESAVGMFSHITDCLENSEVPYRVDYKARNYKRISDIYDKRYRFITYWLHTGYELVKDTTLI